MKPFLLIIVSRSCSIQKTIIRYKHNRDFLRRCYKPDEYPINGTFNLKQCKSWCYENDYCILADWHESSGKCYIYVSCPNYAFTKNYKSYCTLGHNDPKLTCSVNLESSGPHHIYCNSNRSKFFIIYKLSICFKWALLLY